LVTELRREDKESALQEYQREYEKKLRLLSRITHIDTNGKKIKNAF
jgi:hypothetical protein